MTNKQTATGFFLLDQFTVGVSYVKGTQRLVEIDLLGTGTKKTGYHFLPTAEPERVSQRFLHLLRHNF